MMIEMGLRVGGSSNAKDLQSGAAKVPWTLAYLPNLRHSPTLGIIKWTERTGSNQENDRLLL
jgi:hypothetical protein